MQVCLRYPVWVEKVRFSCVPGCVKCCDEPGFVYLTESDLKRAAALLGLTACQFERKYVYRTTHLLRLRKPRGKQCPFLGLAGCKIHKANPTQCRAFPFWPELIASKTEWSKAARRCPGIGRGSFVPLEAVQRIANEMREGYPTMYE